MQIFFSITFAPFTRLALSRPFHVVEWFSPNKSLRVICVRQGKSVSHGHPLKYKVFHYPADPHNSHCYNDNDRLVPRTFFWSWEIKTSLFKVVVKIDMQFSDHLLRLPLEDFNKFLGQISNQSLMYMPLQFSASNYQLHHRPNLRLKRWKNCSQIQPHTMLDMPPLTQHHS